MCNFVLNIYVMVNITFKKWLKENDGLLVYRRLEYVLRIDLYYTTVFKNY